MLSATDADYNIRAIAIREIKNRLLESDISDDEKVGQSYVLQS